MTPVDVDGVKPKIHVEHKNEFAFADKCARRKVALKKNSSPEAEIDQLKQICCSLLRVAQQYVPTTPNAFAAFVEVTQCTKMLQKLGAEPEVAAKFNAVLGTTGDEFICNSPDYRYLRNTAIAGFATIVDLAEKSAATGVPEFQRGVQEGYRRASKIALRFLTDIEGEN